MKKQIKEPRSFSKLPFELDSWMVAEFRQETKDLGITQKELFCRMWQNYTETIGELRQRKKKKSQ